MRSCRAQSVREQCYYSGARGEEGRGAVLRAVLGVGRGLTALSAVLARGGGLYLVLHFGGVAGLSAVFGGGGGLYLVLYLGEEFLLLVCSLPQF